MEYLISFPGAIQHIFVKLLGVIPGATSVTNCYLRTLLHHAFRQDIPSLIPKHRCSNFILSIYNDKLFREIKSAI